MKYLVVYIGVGTGTDFLSGNELFECALTFDSKQDAQKKARNLRRQVYRGRKRYSSVELVET